MEIRKVKLLIGITLSEIGGAQKVVYDIVSGINPEKFSIEIVTSQNGELLKWIRELNSNRSSEIKIEIIPYLKREISIKDDIKVFKHLYTLIKQRKYDVVHFHSSKMGLFGRLAAWLNKVPKIIFTVHGWGYRNYTGFIKRKIFESIELFGGRMSTKIVCVSKYDLQKGIEKGWIKQKQAVLINNGIAPIPEIKGKLLEKLHLPRDNIIVGTIMRLQEPKNPIFTIKVFEEIKKRGHKAKLIIIGDGIKRENCTRLIEKLNLKSDVYIMGMCENARELLNDFDIFTLFSKWESLPISIIEAMYSGKPILASAVGGVPELVINGYNGYILRSNNVQMSAHMLEKIINDKQLRYTMGQKSRLIAQEKFTQEKMIKAYEKIYLS